MEMNNVNGVAEIAVPQECEICLCCKRWEGNVERAAITPGGRYGGCDVYGKRVLSTNYCYLFKADLGRVSLCQRLFYHSNKFRIR